MSIAWQIPSLTKSSCLHFGQKKWCGLLHSLMECSLPLWVPFLKTCQTTRLNKWGARKLMSFHYSRLFATVLWHVWELSRITVNSRSHSPWCHLQGFKVWPVQQAVQAVILWHRFLTTCSSCNIYIYIFTVCSLFGVKFLDLILHRTPLRAFPGLPGSPLPFAACPPKIRDGRKREGWKASFVT